MGDTRVWANQVSGPRPIAERFWEKVDRRGPDECWLWRSAVLTGIERTGRPGLPYGVFQMPDGGNGRTVKAHRVAYELVVGPIPVGLTIDHLCRNTLCVNPSHLEPVTMRENTLRGTSPVAVNAVKDSCKRGHPFDEANTRWDRGWRQCRECDRIRARGTRRRRREQLS